MAASESIGTGEYVRLEDPFVDPESSRCCCTPKNEMLWWWAKVAVVCLCLAAGAAAFIIFCGPLIINKVVIPILNWELTTFSTPVLGLLIFASIGLLPVLLLPSSPPMWIAGMTFGYGYGFLLIMAGASLGMSLPFFTGSLFSHRINRWLENWPDKAALVRLAVVATKIKYGPYLAGSMVGIVPETFLTIYSGRLLRSLADAADRGGFLSLQQVLYVAVSFSVALAASVAITIYAKRTLQALQAEAEDELSHCNPDLQIITST